VQPLTKRALRASRPAAGVPPSAKRPGDATTPGRWAQSPAVFLAVILTAQLMVVLDATIVNVALPRMQVALGFSPAGLSWVLNAYVLTFGGLLLLGARAGDLLGRRRVFLLGIALFAGGSMLGGMAGASSMLLAARAAQGVGAALAAPTALSMLTSELPEGPSRVRAIGLYTAVSAAGGAIGLVAGGVLTELLSWRWVMFVNVPIGVAVLAIGRVVLTESSRRRGRADVAGAVASTLGMTGLVLGLVEAGTEGFAAPSSYVPLVAGAALLAAFGLIERRAPEPVVPLRLLAHATRSGANAARGLISAGMYGTFFFMTQFLQDLDRYSPLRAGVAFLPMPVSVFLGSQLASRVLLRRMRPRAVMITGIVLATASLGVASTIGRGAGYGQVLLMLVPLGIGSGISFVSLTSASLVEVGAKDAGVASGLVNVSQQLGGALGLAVLVTVFGAATHHLRVTASSGEGLAAQVQSSFLGGMHDVFGVAALLSAAALVVVGTTVGRARRPPALPGCPGARARCGACRRARGRSRRDGARSRTTRARGELSRHPRTGRRLVSQKREPRRHGHWPMRPSISSRSRPARAMWRSRSSILPITASQGDIGPAPLPWRLRRSSGVTSRFGAPARKRSAKSTSARHARHACHARHASSADRVGDDFVELAAPVGGGAVEAGGVLFRRSARGRWPVPSRPGAGPSRAATSWRSPRTGGPSTQRRGRGTSARG
jgi:EmrB/QacA subfamily drug resistance transporter